MGCWQRQGSCQTNSQIQGVISCFQSHIFRFECVSAALKVNNNNNNKKTHPPLGAPNDFLETKVKKRDNFEVLYLFFIKTGFILLMSNCHPLSVFIDSNNTIVFKKKKVFCAMHNLAKQKKDTKTICICSIFVLLFLTLVMKFIHSTRHTLLLCFTGIITCFIVEV